jgi:hypothetical protein
MQQHNSYVPTSDILIHVNTLRTGDADLRLYAYKQFKYPVPNVLNWKQQKRTSLLLTKYNDFVVYCDNNMMKLHDTKIYTITLHNW